MMRVESRYLRRRWLTKWWPGNVYAMVLTDQDLSWPQGVELAQEAMRAGAFGVVLEREDGILALGGVNVLPSS